MANLDITPQINAVRTAFEGRQVRTSLVNALTATQSAVNTLAAAAQTTETIAARGTATITADGSSTSPSAALDLPSTPTADTKIVATLRAADTPNPYLNIILTLSYNDGHIYAVLSDAANNGSTTVAVKAGTYYVDWIMLDKIEDYSNMLSLLSDISDKIYDVGTAPIAYTRLDFIAPSANLYNMGYMPVYSGYSHNGSIIASSSWQHIRVPVQPNTKYTVSNAHHFIEFYSAGGQYISHTSANGSDVTDYTFTAPDNAAWVYITISAAYNLALMRINKGTSVNCDIVPTKIISSVSSNAAPKKVTFIGDSITAGLKTTFAYHMFVAQRYGAHCYNYGVSGSGYCKSITGTNVCGGGAEGVGTSQTVPADKTYLAMAGAVNTDSDIYVIAGGVNDYTANIAQATFKAAVENTLKKIMEIAPKAAILVITPLAKNATGSSGNPDGEVANGVGLTLRDYVDDIIEVCRRYSVPCINAYAECGFTPYTEGGIANFMPDGIHPNAAGHRRLGCLVADRIARFMEE